MLSDGSRGSMLPFVSLAATAGHYKLSSMLGRGHLGLSGGTTTAVTSQTRLGGTQKQKTETHVEIGSKISEIRIWVNQRILESARFRVPSILVDLVGDSEDGVWVVTDHNSTVYGCGDTPDHATDDYLLGLVNQWQWGERFRDELAPHLYAELQWLERILEPAPGI